MKKILLLATMLLTLATGANAQRTMDKLDRGLVAVPSEGGTFVSWRIFGEEYYDTEYNLYRDGVKINDKPLHVSNFTDAGGKASSQYQVAAVVRGVEQAKCNAVSRSSVQYKQFAVKSLYSRRGTNITSDYNINDTFSSFLMCFEQHPRFQLRPYPKLIISTKILFVEDKKRIRTGTDPGR